MSNHNGMLSEPIVTSDQYLSLARVVRQVALSLDKEEAIRLIAETFATIANGSADATLVCLLGDKQA